MTTHSMEEAEALSTKLCIMVMGRLKCYGSSQHIKNKFGQGYEIEFKIKAPTSEDLIHLKNRIPSQNRVELVNRTNAHMILQVFEATNLRSELTVGGIGQHLAQGVSN